MATELEDALLKRNAELKATIHSLRQQFPGLVARHAVITDECRRNRGDAGAVTEAFGRLAEAFWDAAGGWPQGRGVKIHLILAVERPEVKS